MINLNDIDPLLLGVEKPGRYTGGEFGRLAQKDAPLQTLIAFPDLYEIGMSNQALRIIYNELNRIPGISCDRAFAPAPDFERLLRDKGLPLYGLDTGISLKRLDLLLFTLGYELGISGILAMLDVSGIPLHSDQRGEDDPVLIAGGPAVSNPLPYCNFIDAFWIGEAEAGFFDLARELLEIKQNGGNRSALLARIRQHPHIWVKGKEKVSRAIAYDWAESFPHPRRARPPEGGLPSPDTVDSSCAGSGHIYPSTPLDGAIYPIPSMKIVQHHGTLEIMRGCPNGCRFCHAGYWYRPMRQKSHDVLIREAEALITQGGYREISLSSLSTGDYTGIGELVDSLNERFSGRHVSFQLPSLRVSTFSLSLLEKISQTRKSGLTFAVETPLAFWQLSINKQVTSESVVEILREAKRNGWRGAKFYFMIGLPVPGEFSEETEIVNFVTAVGKKTAMHFNVNVGIFVPKPHTPYQWARQIDRETAAIKLDFIRSRLKSLGHKVSLADPLVSTLEGVLSRGDERAGTLAEAAFRAGSRLDAWQEFMAKDVWQDILEQNAGLAGEFLSAKDPDSPLFWQDIGSGVSPAYMRREWEKSERGELTPPCAAIHRIAPVHGTAQCPAPCGVCSPHTGIVHNEKPESRNSAPPPETSAHPDPTIWRLLFSFTKEDSAVFHGHLSLIEIFSMAMARADLDVRYTQGFNPLAKLEIVSPLSIGIAAVAEIAVVEFSHEVSPGAFREQINAALPEGIRVNRAECYRIPAGSKKHSLSSLLWGFGYDNPDGETAYIPAKGEKTYREQRLSSGGTVFSLRRTGVLAKNILINEPEQPWASYFDVYRHLYAG
jgi:radical SAM superfamily enzyme YgiQ (UPF0313 family)